MKIACKLGFVGGGNMAQALLTGLKSQQFAMSDITVIELSSEKCLDLTNTFGVSTSIEFNQVIKSDVIVLAIKPQHLPTIAKTMGALLSNQLIISIAAGIRLSDLSRWLGGYKKIIRAMPNTPAQIQAGITGLYAMPSVSSDDMHIAEQILNAVGSTLWLDAEDKLDAITAISGSGPAYVFYLIEALHEAALQLGLNEAQAKALSITTFKGASLLADASSTPVAKLREQVTSKGGTTEQGLLSLEASNVRQAIVFAAEKACARAKSLGDELGQQ